MSRYPHYPAFTAVHHSLSALTSNMIVVAQLYLQLDPQSLIYLPSSKPHLMGIVNTLIETE